MQEQEEKRRENGGPEERQFGESRVIDSRHLFADRREVQIRHRGESYRLLMTKNGKLILNK